MEAAATEQVGTGNWSSARSNFSGISASDEDVQVVLQFISNVDGPLSLASCKESLLSEQAGQMNHDATGSFSDRAVFPLSKRRRELLEKFFLAEEGDEVLKVSTEARSGLTENSGMPEKACNEFQDVGQKMLVRNRAQSIGTDLTTDTDDTEKHAGVQEVFSQSSCPPPNGVECSKEQVARRRSTVHDDNAGSTADKARLVLQQTHHETVTAPGEVAEMHVESLQEASPDSGARGIERHLFPIPSRASNERDGSRGIQISSQRGLNQEHRSLNLAAGRPANRVPSSSDGFSHDSSSREEYYASLNKPVVRLKQKRLPSRLVERNETAAWPVTSNTRAEGICSDDRCRRAANNLKVHDPIQIELGGVRDRDNRMSSAGMLNLAEDRRRKLAPSSQQVPEEVSQLQKQDSYPIFAMVDRPTHISDVPFMRKAQLDTLSRVHSARHGRAVSQIESSDSMTSEIEIVEPTSEKSCTFSDFLTMTRPSTPEVVTLRQLLRQPQSGTENWERVEPVDSKTKRRSHNKHLSDVDCYCHVPNYAGRSVRYRPKTKRQTKKNKLQLDPITGGQDSCHTRTAHCKSTSLPSSAVPLSAGRYSKDVSDSCPQARSRSVGRPYQQTSSASTKVRCKEGLGAGSRRGETRLRDENPSSWKFSPPMHSGRRGRRQMDERILSDFPRILGAIQASRDRQGICIVNGKQSDDTRRGNEKPSVRNAVSAALLALDSSNRRLSLSPSLFERSNNCAGRSRLVRQRYPSLSGADWISEAADEHSVISPRSYSQPEEAPVEMLTQLPQPCPPSGPDYLRSRLRLDPDYRIQNVEMDLQEHQDSYTCDHNHSSSESDSDKEVLTRSNIRRSLLVSPGLDFRLGRWSHFTGVGFFQGILGLAVTSIRATSAQA